ncbi:unnamed protein product [Paramecium pentaurelia]|uniref:Uncharacterized protein n=1 Tax=Paramecium pentaurelia TaxID=43138 RepID=A0A8S1XQH9_9CILI|nr:unnamed protein product [Paramecium pentaurelia]
MKQRERSHAYLYKQICKHLDVPFSSSLLNGIQETEIVIVLDQISQQDIEPLSLLLPQCKFKRIIIKSIQKNLKLNKSMATDNQKMELLEILRVITKLFTKSLDVVSLVIRDIRMNSEHMQIIAQGIAVVQSLKELRIIQCLMTSNHFSILQPSLIQNSSLHILDLSHNYLTHQIGVLLGQLIQEHSKRRDNVEYLYRIKGECPEEDISKIGLEELDLSYNKLNDQFVKDIVPFLERDRWIKQINLKYNAIQKEGFEILIQLLDKNQTITSLDIRRNLGSTQQFYKEVLKKLIRNKNTKNDIQQQRLDDDNENISVNVSAIPQNLQSVISDQESPVMSFGVFEPNNLTKQMSNSGRQDQLKFKSGFKNNDFGCSDCNRLQIKSKKQQQIIQLLKQEVQFLRFQLQSKSSQLPEQQQQQQSQQQVINELNFSENNHNPPPQEIEQDDMVNKIEYMMNDLTRMMDGLDVQGSVTNNLNAHLSSTLIVQDYTRAIFEREDRANDLMNILDQNSNNNLSQSSDEEQQ